MSRMSINKRELLEKLTKEDSFRSLAPEEIRLYLLLIILGDEVKGEGRISSKVLTEYLGSNFLKNQLEKAVHDLENLHLAKLSISSPGSQIEFELLTE